MQKTFHLNLFSYLLPKKCPHNLLKKFSKRALSTISKERVTFNDKLNVKFSKDDSGKNIVFFDFQSTTPLDPRVLDAMLPYLTVRYGNPHSKSHEYGWEAEKAVEEARNVLF
jgi:selenocysteine lyase/cysteine desulfurase